MVSLRVPFNLPHQMSLLFHLKSIFLLSFLPFFLIAQNDTSRIQLSQLPVSATRIYNFANGCRLQNIDSNLLKINQLQSLSDVLQQQSGLSMKTYGTSGLSTASARGTGAGHTAVLWNGFNLQNNMNGVIDFNLLPAFIANKILIQSGGETALNGNGAVGGVVHLQNTNEKIEHKAMLALGSFSDYRAGFVTGFEHQNIKSSIKISYATIQNDFSFQDWTQVGKPIRKQENAAAQLLNMIQHNHIQLPNNQLLTTDIWFQTAQRQIAPSITEKGSDAAQKDRAFRFATAWKIPTNNWIFENRVGIFDEFLNFKQGTINDDSRSLVVTGVSEAIFNQNNHRLNIGLQYQYIKAFTENYPSTFYQYRPSIFGAYRLIINEKHIVNTAIRQEIINGSFIPFVASVGWEGKMMDNFKLKSNISKNYKTPTFNDLYWNGAGNANLLPEAGWAGELTGVCFLDKTVFSHKIEVTAFAQKVQNWIIWLPQSDNIWRPSNIKTVFARGLEASYEAKMKLEKANVSFRTDYQFTRSTNAEVAASVIKNSIDKQLIYVPVHKAQFSVQFSHPTLSIFYAHQVFGKRFTTSDNSSALPIYDIANVIFSKSFQIKNTAFYTQFKINNVYNAVYQVIAANPMPGRNFQLSVTTNLHPKK
jgi:vitamin B12 transporter